MHACEHDVHKLFHNVFINFYLISNNMTYRYYQENPNKYNYLGSREGGSSGSTEGGGSGEGGGGAGGEGEGGFDEAWRARAAGAGAAGGGGAAPRRLRVDGTAPAQYVTRVERAPQHQDNEESELLLFCTHT